MKKSFVASELANAFGRHQFSTHRGYMPLDEEWETVAIFGNDGWSDERAREEIRLIRQFVTAKGGEEIDFGICDGAYT